MVKFVFEHIIKCNVPLKRISCHLITGNPHKLDEMESNN